MASQRPTIERTVERLIDEVADWPHVAAELDRLAPSDAVRAAFERRRV